MADCLISAVKEIGKCIVTPYLWPFLKPHVEAHFDYWWLFDSNIQGLRNGIRDLEGKICDLKARIEAARLLLEVVRPGVEEWLNASTDKLEEARKILLPDDNIPKACNLISRYSLGKKAKETAEEIAKHLINGNFDTIADPAPPAAMGFTSDGSTMDFESRKHIEEEIIDSLKQTSVGMIGIFGMGGVGKTTMAKRIGVRVKEENLFEEVVMVTVSQTIDMLKIQREIAELLGLKLHEEDLAPRAYKLRLRLTDSKRKIIILDDVWDSLSFENLGIPIESNFERCKVVLTSRSIHTCKGIKNTKVFELGILENEEAWNLFRDKAGECAEDSVLNAVARDVVAECKSLPIALVTVGTALQNQRNISIWNHSLSQLRRCNPKYIPGVLAKVYNPLKLSYDYLNNDTERDIFLMCCLFPEDYDIPIEQLTWYSMGLQLFDDITNIEEARNLTHGLVQDLRSRFLLIDGADKFHVKMHDVVRDVAIYIGSKEKNGFLKSLTSIKNSSDDNCNWISVDISNERMEVPLVSLFPKLQLLILLKSSSKGFSDICFEGMKDLIVLSLRSISIRSLPPTLGSLENLQTLCLFRCQVPNISVIGELTSLKIFSCYGCKNITELPAEIGRLKGLRLLELNGCRKLQRIPFGVISSLLGLEELKMRGSFSRWEAEENGKERRNASLTELERLPNLTCLEIEIDDSTLSAQEFSLSQNLVKYYIRIGPHNHWNDPGDYEKVMILNLPSAVGNWIRLLARNAESLTLTGNGSENINLAETRNLRNLGFSGCSTVKKLVIFPSLETLRLYELESLEEICYRNQNVSLCNLKSIHIWQCSNLKHLYLKHLFSVSVARTGLSQLEDLRIQRCAAMEQVFWNEGTDDNTDGCIEFPKLKELRLLDLPNLTAFCQGLGSNIIIKFPKLTEMEIGGLRKLNSLFPLNSETLHDHTTSSLHFVCNPKVEMSLLNSLIILNLGDNIRNIWCRQIPINFFNNIQRLRIYFGNGRSLMSTSIAINLVNLITLEISFCGEMVEVIERDDDDKQVVDINRLFPNLRQLSIEYLGKLRWFWQWNHALELPLLEAVVINNCPVMETFTLGSINTPNIRMIGVNNKQIDVQKDLNDVMRHIWIESSKADGDRNGTENENEDKDESEDEYNNENVNKDDDSNERK